MPKILWPHKDATYNLPLTEESQKQSMIAQETLLGHYNSKRLIAPTTEASHKLEQETIQGYHSSKNLAA